MVASTIPKDLSSRIDTALIITEKKMLPGITHEFKTAATKRKGNCYIPIRHYRALHGKKWFGIAQMIEGDYQAQTFIENSEMPLGNNTGRIVQLKKIHRITDEICYGSTNEAAI